MIVLHTENLDWENTNALNQKQIKIPTRFWWPCVGFPKTLPKGESFLGQDDDQSPCLDNQFGLLGDQEADVVGSPEVGQFQWAPGS